MAFDRSKFQAVKKENLQKQKEAAIAPSMGSNTRPDYVDLQRGENILRIFPPHPGGESFVYQKVVNWLPYEKKEDDGKIEIKRRPIFNPIAHSNFKDADPVGFYRELVKKTVEQENTDASIIKEKMNSLYHYKNGIPTQYKWVCYGQLKNDKGNNFGRIEFGTSVKDQLDKLAFSEDDPDSVMEIDPFTDPDTGFSIKIDYNDPKKVKPQDVYVVSFNTKNYIPIKSPIENSDLEKFSEMDSLKEMFENTFTQKDLDKILEGLQIFDKQNNFGVVNSDEFLDFIESIYNQYPSVEKEETTSNKEEGVGLPWENDEEEKEERVLESPSANSKKEDLNAKLAEMRAKMKR